MLRGVLRTFLRCGMRRRYKGGAWGDPARAQELEYLSLLPGLGALALATATPLNYPRKSVAVRATLTVLSFVAVGSALLVGGIGAEFNGSHTCSTQWRH